MFKLYKKADILEKISDKVKTVDDLLNLPLSEFDRECCDYWFNDYLPVGFSTLESFLTNKREDLLREVADLTTFLPFLRQNNPDYPF